MSDIDSLLENNAQFAASFAGDSGPSRPARRTAVVTCMDARIDPVALLGVEPGEVHVLRNAGGAVTEDVIRSLTISQRLLGTREIMLIHHTDCGMRTVAENDLKDTIEQETSVRPAFALEAFSDLEENLRRSLARVRASPFLPHKAEVRAFVYEVESGRLREIV